jgi:hypothetical protein
MKTFSILSLLSIFLFSCERSEEPETIQPKRVDSILETTPGGGYSGMYYYNYDEAGRLLRMSHHNLAAGSTDSFYTAFDRTPAGKITKITMGLRTSPVPAEFFPSYYLNTDLIVYVIKMHNGRRDSFHFTANYPLNYVDQYYKDPSTQQYSYVARTVFDFSFGNLGEIKRLPPNSPIATRLEKFSYDSKKSPFTTNINEILLTEGMLGGLPLSLLNNVVAQDISSPAGNFSAYAITTSYTYNLDETPATALITNHQINSTRKYEYFYK